MFGTFSLSFVMLLAWMIPVCMGVVIAACCRINLMYRGEHRFLWSLMYVAMAAFAGALLVQTLHSREWPDDADLWALLAIALNTALTHQQWLKGPPAIVNKPKR
jgi:hypothetical protein